MWAQVPHVVAVAFLVVWVEPYQQRVLHFLKQQHLTALITALRHQCPLHGISKAWYRTKLHYAVRWYLMYTYLMVPIL